MLLTDTSELLGLEEDGGLSFVVRDPPSGSIAVVGAPRRDMIQEAASLSGRDAEIIAQFQSQGAVVGALPDWRREEAVLYMLGDSTRLAGREEVDPLALAGGSATVVERPRVLALSMIEVQALSVPEELARELTLAALRTLVWATIVDGNPVSFCYAGSETETLWDVSVDTLEAHRGRGYARACASAVIDQMYRDRSKHPVWGALDSNVASKRLASKLGFVEVDRVLLFEPPTAGR